MPNRSIWVWVDVMKCGTEYAIIWTQYYENIPTFPRAVNDMLHEMWYGICEYMNTILQEYFYIPGGCQWHVAWGIARWNCTKLEQEKKFLQSSVVTSQDTIAWWSVVSNYSLQLVLAAVDDDCGEQKASIEWQTNARAHLNVRHAL
jgi:hypothetical protein